MQKEAGKSLCWWVVAVLFGFVIGYLTTNGSSEVKKLRAELAQLKQKQNEQSPILRKSANTPAPNLVVAHQPQYTGNFTNSYTPAEWEVNHQIGLRQQKGEYILKDESPVARRDFKHMVNNRFSVALSNNAIAYSSVFSELGL